MSECYSETNVHEHIFQIDRHFHNQYEIYLNLSGDVSFMVEGNVYPVTRGDMIVTKAYEYHNCIYRSDKPHKHYWILFAFEDETILPFPFSIEAQNIFSKVHKMYWQARPQTFWIQGLPPGVARPYSARPL